MKLVRTFVIAAVLATIAPAAETPNAAPAAQSATSQVFPFANGAVVLLRTSVQAADGIQLIVVFSDKTERRMFIPRKRANTLDAVSAVFVEYDPAKVYIDGINAMAFFTEIMP
jgi:hypothetical protein